MTDVDEAAKARKLARDAAREQRSADAAVVMREVVAAKDAELAKTARLRALRLAKEEADRADAAQQAGDRPKTVGRKRSPAS